MQFTKRHYWGIAAVVLFAIAMFIVAGKANSRRKAQINTCILENLSTETQTWNGIVIGQTTEAEVEERLFELDHVKKSSINTITRGDYTYINWGWKTSPDNANSSIRCKDGFVDRIILSFSDKLTVESIIEDFGFPDEVYVSPVGELSKPIFWNLTLYYLEEGINIGANSRKLKKTFSFSDKVELIELFAPEQISSAQDLAFVYGIDIRDIAHILPMWVPTKDKQLFEAYLELFRQTEMIPFGPEGIFEISGYDLGMFIASRKVKILRDGTIYDKNGTLIECPVKSYGCSYRTSVEPKQNNHIFINGLQAASINFHAGIIAHEAFHLSLPFNTQQNSLYEEMSAITIAYIASKGEYTGQYITAPPPNLATTYTRAEIADYITTYCGDTCPYLDLPIYPDTWGNFIHEDEED